MESCRLDDCRRDDRWQVIASVRKRREVLTCEAQWEAMMDPLEGQAKAIIAAALIVRGAVEVPAIPTGTERVPDAGGMRLRELTDYVYRLLTTDQPPEPE
jgi:hypothetical protein